jgi:hypothetical protein
MIASDAVIKGRVGRPRASVTPEQVNQLRSQGASWRRIAKALGIGTATAMRLYKSCDGGRPSIQHIALKTSDKI